MEQTLNESLTMQRVNENADASCLVRNAMRIYLDASNCEFEDMHQKHAYVISRWTDFVDALNEARHAVDRLAMDCHMHERTACFLKSVEDLVPIFIQLVHRSEHQLHESVRYAYQALIINNNARETTPDSWRVQKAIRLSEHY